MPRPPAPSAACKAKPQELGPAETASAAPKTATTATGREAGDGRAAFVRDAPTVATATLTTTGAAEHIAPHVLSIAHWDRLLEGELYASSDSTGVPC